MVSQTFSLGEEGQKGVCTKVLLLLIMGAVVAAAVIVGIFAFRSSHDESKGCQSPLLDPNGLSNFTTGATTIAFACFPGFFVDSNTEKSNIMISQCKDNNWEPEPPTCNFLPLRLDCAVTNHGLEGEISMIQMSVKEPTNIFGFVKYGNAIKSEGHINDIIPLSRSTPQCRLSQDYNITQEIESLGAIDEKYVLKIQFESQNLAAYREAEIHINMIFLDINTTATIISCHQGSYVLVMPTELPHIGRTTKKTPVGK
ncbi:unnamed protein product [Allacma fusca]|uniref:Sushi domain-containing protein n=1 Tax=Allacma fusca TaxID=39272 RepID=A0A8J2PIR6_9HEXA|nr:unnamed protein product [Allacma fusca]